MCIDPSYTHIVQGPGTSRKDLWALFVQSAQELDAMVSAENFDKLTDRLQVVGIVIGNIKHNIFCVLAQVQFVLN